MFSRNGQTLYILSYPPEGSQTYQKRPIFICSPSFVYGRVSQSSGISDVVHSSGYMAEREGDSQDAIGMAHPGPGDSDDSIINFTCAPKDSCRG